VIDKEKLPIQTENMPIGAEKAAGSIGWHDPAYHNSRLRTLKLHNNKE
jgi:hypothetical protein